MVFAGQINRIQGCQTRQSTRGNHNHGTVMGVGSRGSKCGRVRTVRGDFQYGNIGRTAGHPEASCHTAGRRTRSIEQRQPGGAPRRCLNGALNHVHPNQRVRFEFYAQPQQTGGPGKPVGRVTLDVAARPVPTQGLPRRQKIAAVDERSRDVGCKKRPCASKYSEPRTGHDQSSTRGVHLLRPRLEARAGPVDRAPVEEWPRSWQSRVLRPRIRQACHRKPRRGSPQPPRYA